MIQQGKTTATEARSKSAPETSASKSDSRTPPPNDGLRETVESVVVAFVLAFLFRTFEAEAFVIPTGSMAPTLMGRHKDLACEHCGFPYRVSAKDEVDDEGRRYEGIQMETSVCPNCRYTMDLGSRPKQAQFPSFKGDRILVGKFPYNFNEPERWDVVVFKFPIRAHQNFIKRLVGLPNETIRIVHGDIYVKPATEQDFSIARKPPEKLLAMLQTVYDNDYASPEMVEKGWPPRWQAWAESVNQAVLNGFPQSQHRLADTNGDWKVSDDLTQFEYRGEGSEPAWIRYTHTVPSPVNWNDLKAGRQVEAKPLPIEDFNAYNMGQSNDARQYHPYYPAWVGDLGVECEVEVASSQGELILELVEGNVQFQCRFDVASGEVQMSHTADPSFKPKATTHVKGPGIYRLAFVNVDDELLLWIDGKLGAFDVTTAYGPLPNTNPRELDFAPVGIAARGIKARVGHLRIVRDIYYLASRMQSQGDNPHGEDFVLNEDQFFVLGDNSAASLDARYWEQGYGNYVRYVDRELMIGKALLIYWPHGWYEIPGTGIPFYIPIVDAPMYPNFARMGYVR